MLSDDNTRTPLNSFAILHAFTSNELGKKRENQL